MRASRRRPAAVLALAGWASLAAAAPASAGSYPQTGAIVFDRSQSKDGGMLRSSSLWRTTSTRIPLRLTAANGRYNGAASWSPDGTHIAYEYGSTTVDRANRFDIRVMDSEGGHLFQLTSGVGNFELPVWGPGIQIAFVSRYNGRRNCLSITQAGALLPHDLFCPPSPTQLMRPMWSRDGASLYVAGGYTVGGVDGFWRSLVYRVDATTGSVVVLVDEVLEQPRSLEFAPDGSRGIYSDVYTSQMDLVDFATGRLTPIGRGYAPRWSRDSRRIAFTGEIYEFTPPDFRFYEPLYVMNADGSNVRRITRSRVDNHAYTAVDWSNDGIHLLVNRRIYLDPSLTIRRYALRIVNVDTREVTALPGGYAEPGAWFEP